MRTSYLVFKMEPSFWRFSFECWVSKCVMCIWLAVSLLISIVLVCCRWARIKQTVFRWSLSNYLCQGGYIFPTSRKTADLILVKISPEKYLWPSKRRWVLEVIKSRCRSRSFWRIVQRCEIGHFSIPHSGSCLWKNRSDIYEDFAAHRYIFEQGGPPGDAPGPHYILEIILLWTLDSQIHIGLVALAEVCTSSVLISTAAFRCESCCSLGLHSALPPCRAFNN